MGLSVAAEKFLSKCGGIQVKTVDFRNKLFKVGELEMPKEPMYLKINATATKGTVGRIIGIHFRTFAQANAHYEGKPNERQVYEHDITFVYEIDGRPKPGSISDKHATVLDGVHQTAYVRSVNKQPKPEVKAPVNKFKQELKRGDWIFGISQDKRLIIGRVTRWTNHNVWCSTGDVDDKSKEVLMYSIQETFLAPDDKHLSEITLAVLKGWKGW